jgi:hypothetical protein
MFHIIEGLPHEPEESLYCLELKAPYCNDERFIEAWSAADMGLWVPFLRRQEEAYVVYAMAIDFRDQVKYYINFVYHSLALELQNNQDLFVCLSSRNYLLNDDEIIRLVLHNCICAYVQKFPEAKNLKNAITWLTMILNKIPIPDPAQDFSKCREQIQVIYYNIELINQKLVRNLNASLGNLHLFKLQKQRSPDKHYLIYNSNL